MAVEPGVKAATSLIIVDVDDNSWIERAMGDSGGRDRAPDDPPPFEPDADLLFPSPGRPTESAPPDTAPSDPGPSGPSEPEAPTDPGPAEPSDDFGDTPPEEPWEDEEEGYPDVAPEPTQVLPAEPDEPSGPDGPIEPIEPVEPVGPDEPMEAGLDDVFAG